MVIYDRWINSVFSAGSSISTSGSNIIMSAPEEGNWIQLTTEVEAGIDNSFSFDVPVLEGAAESGMQVMIIETRDNTPYVIGGGYLMPGGRKQTISFNASGNTVNLLFNGPFSTAEIEQICTHYTKTTQQTYLVEVCDESKDKYRFGFGNQEKINEVSGIGNTIDMGDRWLDTRIGRTPKTDLHKSKYPSISPYAYALNNPIIYNDPDGKDAKITINKNVITVTTVIQIYGDAAIQDIVNTYQSGITEKWHLQSDGTNWNYTDPKTNEIYDVVFVTDVKLYKGKEKLNPFIISESWNPTNTDNFIKVSSKQNRSNVRLGDEGVWRSEGRELKDQSGNVIRKMSLAEDNPAAHELGHLLGLRDRYSDEGGVFKGWEGNIMGNSGTGKVEQRNIDAVVEDAVKQYNSSSEKKKGKQFETKIDVAFPDK